MMHHILEKKTSRWVLPQVVLLNIFYHHRTQYFTICPSSVYTLLTSFLTILSLLHSLLYSTYFISHYAFVTTFFTILYLDYPQLYSFSPLTSSFTTLYLKLKTVYSVWWYLTGARSTWMKGDLGVIDPESTR